MPKNKRSKKIVVMGVAGCGKSSLAERLARALGWRLVEGDDVHSAANRAKMANGVALNDDDRRGWLDALGVALASDTQGVVVTCSALKRTYRDRLRASAPGLQFVFLDISHAEATQRVAARAERHFFSATLVDSQFATLEKPDADAEADVLRLDGSLPLESLLAAVIQIYQGD